MERRDEEQLQGVTEALSSAFRRSMPRGKVIAAKAVSLSLAGHESDADWIKRNFSALVEQVQDRAYEEYLLEEQKAGSQALVDTFVPILDPEAKASDSVRVVGEHFRALDRFFLGLAQGRRPRAGKAFEFVLRELFGKLNYPFSEQPIINGQPDFLMPSEEHFRRNPPDCIIFTVKRTLRERWRQIVTEGTRGLGFFLATIDEKVAARDLPAMLASRINLVVPERVKVCRKDYEKAANVITFESFFRFHLDPAITRWQAHGII